MENAIAGIVASLELQTSAFIANAKKAGDALDKSTVQMRRSMRDVERAAQTLDNQFGKLRNAAVGLAAAFAVRQFAQFTKSALDSAGATLELARAAGISAERLQSLRYAAGQTGVGAASLDAAMLKLNKNIGDAAGSSTGPAADAFRRLGVNILDANGKVRSTEAVFNDVAARFKGIDDAATAASLGVDLFGREAGTKLPLLLRDTANGMASLEGAARSLGLVLSTTMLQSADDASDKIGAMQEVFKAAFDIAIITKFSESVDASASTIKNIAEIGKTMGEIVAGAMQGVAAAAEFAAEHMDLLLAAAAGFAGLKLAVVIGGIGKALYELGAAIKALAVTSVAADAVMTKTIVGGLLKIALAAGAAATAYALLNKETKQAGEVGPNHFSFTLPKIPEARAAENTQLAKTQDQLKDIEESEKRRLKLISDIHDVLEKIEKTETETFAKAAEDIIKRELALGDYIEGLEFEARLAGESVEVREKLLALEEARGKVLRDLTAAEKKSIESAVAMGRQNEKIRKQLDEQARFIPDAFERAFDRVGSAVTEAFTRGEDALISLKSVGRAVAADLIQSFAQLALINPLKNALFGGTAATLSGVASSAAGNAAGSGLGSLFGNFAGSAAGKLITAPFGGLSSMLFGKGAVGALGPQIPTSGLLGSGGTFLGSSGLATALPYVGVALGALSLFSAFGKDKKVPNAGGNIKFANDSFAVGDTYTLDGADIGPVKDALNQSVALLNRLTALPQFSVDPSKFTPGFPGFASGFNSKGTGNALTPEGMLRDVITRGQITGLSEVEKSLLLGSSNIAEAIDKLVGSIESGTDAGGLKASLENAILQFTDPKGFAVKMLQAEQQAFRAQLSAAGVLDGLLAQVSQLERLQLADVLKRFTDNVVGANDNFAAAGQKISGFLSDLTASSGSVLPLGQALSNARGEFAALVSDARSGGAGRIAELTPDILSAAQRFNELNRSANASSGEFFNGFNAMTETLRSLQLTLGGGSNTTQRDIFIQGAEQTTELKAIRIELAALTAENSALRASLARLADRMAA